MHLDPDNVSADKVKTNTAAWGDALPVFEYSDAAITYQGSNVPEGVDRDQLYLCEEEKYIDQQLELPTVTNTYSSNTL